MAGKRCPPTPTFPHPLTLSAFLLHLERVTYQIFDCKNVHILFLSFPPHFLKAGSIMHEMMSKAAAPEPILELPAFK